MWQRCVHAELWCTTRAEKHARSQAEPSNAARKSPAATIASSPRYVKGVSRQVSVAAEQAAGALPEIRNDHNIGLIIARAGFQTCFPLAHVVGGSQVCVPVTAPDLQPTEFVDQKEVDHASNSVCALKSRRPFLQMVDVINHRK